eukprot:GHVU01057408.1.p1 GENE.GHVU01057408.1~~GHVU01057408.1.p1  ORF type:complete len:636 (-),score=164.75 GHVU01057408.1:327-2234(-)
MDYINKLEGYEPTSIATIAAQHNLHEPAFAIYKKFNMHSEAADTLLNGIGSIQRATEYAARVNDNAVWSKLGVALLLNGSVNEAIDCFLKSEDPSEATKVITAAEDAGCFEQLVRYLRMVRKNATTRDSCVDSSLAYALAKCDMLGEMEDFTSGTNTADVQAVGDRLFNEELYKAAKLLFQSIPNNARLSSCYVKLREYHLALEAAKKANNPNTWVEICSACVEAEEYRNAHLAGLNIVSQPDHLDSVVVLYEQKGLKEELLQLLEAGIGSEAHKGLYTAVAVAYAKYAPEKLSKFSKEHHSRFNTPRVIEASRKQGLWKEVVFLLFSYAEFDEAASEIMEHSPVAFEEAQFLEIMKNVTKTEVLYKAVEFYLAERPLDVNELLIAVASKVDHARVVGIVKPVGLTALVVPYLKQIQTQGYNIAAVNEALHAVYMEEEDYESLRESLSNFDNYDQLRLASELETHELHEMRRLAGLIYTRNRRFKLAMDLAKKDQQYQDCIEIARSSEAPALVEDLIQFFVSKGDKECLVATLFVCYHLVRPDQVLEWAMLHDCMEQIMPFMIQMLHEYTLRVDLLDKKVEHRELEAEKEKSAPNDYVPNDYSMNAHAGLGFQGGPPPLTGLGRLALMPSYPNQS